MLTISSDTLPNTTLSYLAFRVSFQETLERLCLARSLRDDSDEEFGYLTEVPFFHSVPPQVQMDLLADTWRKHCLRTQVQANLVDESVVYSVCETAALIAESEPTVITHCLISGPRLVDDPVDGELSSKLRDLHLALSSEGEFLLISQFEDMHPDEARMLKQQFDLDVSRLDDMFDILGRWSVSKTFYKNLEGLLSDREIERVVSIVG